MSMTYNTPILMNVAAAFNVVLGDGSLVEQDHSTDHDCREIDGPSTTDTGDCVP
jgi:hypothetical protein